MTRQGNGIAEEDEDDLQRYKKRNGLGAATSCRTAHTWMQMLAIGPRDEDVRRRKAFRMGGLISDGGHSSVGRTGDCDSSSRGFESHWSPQRSLAQPGRALLSGSRGRWIVASNSDHFNQGVAQLAERLLWELEAGGSWPPALTIFNFETGNFRVRVP